MINVDDWPIGVERDAAFLKLLPTDVTARTGALFRKGRDGLDSFEATVLRLRPTFRLRDDITVVLQHYHRYPVAGVKLIIRADDAHHIDLIVGALRLRSADFAWIAPDLRQTIDSAMTRRAQRRKLLGLRPRPPGLREHARRRA